MRHGELPCPHRNRGLRLQRTARAALQQKGVPIAERRQQGEPAEARSDGEGRGSRAGAEGLALRRRHGPAAPTAATASETPAPPAGRPRQPAVRSSHTIAPEPVAAAGPALGKATCGAAAAGHSPSGRGEDHAVCATALAGTPAASTAATKAAASSPGASAGGAPMRGLGHRTAFLARIDGTTPALRMTA